MKIDTVAVIGLGYVGLPLACALSRKIDVTGYDISRKRIDALKKGNDWTGEISPDELTSSPIKFTCDENDIKNKSCYIITVPTPVDGAKKPDLTAVLSSCEIVGKAIGKGAIVTLESTVYPGVTEKVCGPALEKASGLKCGKDFFLGYSPERINPGDKKHSLDKVVKVVAGQTDETCDALLDMYGKVAPVFAAKDIKTAEAAKVIENAQRDINIAFVNELSIIFNKLDIDTGAVLEAAGTKWNFLHFKPGLVGGHCIGVDPYYLTYLAESLGYRPEVILAGRRINDNMGVYTGSSIAKMLLNSGLPNKVLVLGVTFKEDVPDTRNSKTIDVINELRSFGFEVDVHDPIADCDDVLGEYGLQLTEPSGKYSAIVLAVPHERFIRWSREEIESMIEPGGLVADIKGAWRDVEFSPALKVWRL